MEERVPTVGTGIDKEGCSQQDEALVKRSPTPMYK